MRGCLGFLLVVTLVAGLVAWVAPIPAAGLALGVALSGLLAAPVSVEVEADPPPELLTGHADAVAIRASDASLADGRIRAGRLAIRLVDVALFARAAARLDGTLDAVTVGGAGLTVERVTLQGSAGTLLAALLIRSAEAEALVRRALTDAAIPATSIALTAPRSLDLTIDGRLLTTVLEVRGGALLAVPSGSLPPAVLLSAGSVAPLELTGVRVTSEGLVLEGRLPGSILGL